MLYIRDLIKKKRNGEQLTEEEIDFFIDSYYKEEILKEQAATLLILMSTNGLTEKEMTFLSKSISETGKKMKIFELSNKVVDLHPIGGMDDKIVIMLLAVISALELPSIKVIQRELGLKDKIGNSKIYQYNEENKIQIKDIINKNEIVLIEETENIAPVENKLYKLRNDIACNDDISIIAVNLMSQKIALGFRNIMFDISFGEKAYVKTLRDAEELAKSLIKIGNNIERNVTCVITKLDEPIGRFFGNNLEVQEALKALNGEMTTDVREVILEMGAHIIAMESGSNNLKHNKKMILEVLENKKAHNKLLELLKNNNINFSKAENIVPVRATVNGYIESIDMSLIRTTAKYLNAIRHTKDINIESSAGIEFCKKIGDKVEVGEILGYIHTNEDIKVQESVLRLKESFSITSKKIKPTARIVKIYN